MRRIAPIATCLFIALGVRAQPTAYFPHHPGDMWEYFVLDGVGNDTLQVKVVLDSTDPGGVSHVRHRRQLVNPLRPPWFSWYDEFRMDTIGTILGSGLSPPNRLVYRLNTPVGQWWFVHYRGGSGGDLAKVVGEYPSTVFGRQTMIKEIAYFAAGDTSDTTIWLWQYTERLAEGFGTIYRGNGGLGYNLYLRGCLIAGVFYGDTTLVSVRESRYDHLPTECALYPNYPNPFNAATTIVYELPRRSRVQLEIFNMLGQRLCAIVDAVLGAGSYHSQFDASHLPSGTYVFRLTTDGAVLTRKAVLVR